MNRTSKHHTTTPRLLGAAMLGLMAALSCAAPAFADVVDFDSLAPVTSESGVTLSASGYDMLLVEGPVAAAFGLVSGTGTIIDSNNPFSCDVIACPVGGVGNYLGVLNDGAVQFSHPGELHGFTVTGFDFAFLPPAPVGPGNYGQLQLTGVNWYGTTIATSLDFPGQDGNGNFMFGAAALDAAFRGNVFTSLRFNACIYDQDLVCSNSFDNPAFNQAQFALDSVNLNAVPEPASFLLMGLAAGALAFTRRRPSRPAARPTSL
jgi:hypothetical protein